MACMHSGLPMFVQLPQGWIGALPGPVGVGGPLRCIPVVQVRMDFCCLMFLAAGMLLHSGQPRKSWLLHCVGVGMCCYPWLPPLCVVCVLPPLAAILTWLIKCAPQAVRLQLDPGVEMHVRADSPNLSVLPETACVGLRGPCLLPGKQQLATALVSAWAENLL